MQYKVIRLMERHEADSLLQALERFPFRDGKLTATGRARDVKENLQLTAGSEGHEALSQQLLRKVTSNQDLTSFTVARRVLSPMFNRYDVGMSYGAHVDSALMGLQDQVRTDFSLTLFLSPPDSYDGGELVLEPSGDQLEIKLDAGEAIVYPSGTLHCVAPVRRGQRTAAVTWIQSNIRNEQLRGVLTDIRAALKRAEAIDDAVLCASLGKAFQNLLRHAAEN